MSSTRTPLVFVVLALGLAATALAQQGPQYSDNRTVPDTPACKRGLEIAGLLANFDVPAVQLYV